MKNNGLVQTGIILLITAVGCIPHDSVAAQDTPHGTAATVAPRPRWSVEQAWSWYQKQPWVVGFNYVPSTAANTTEFLVRGNIRREDHRSRVGLGRRTGVQFVSRVRAVPRLET